MGGFIAVLFFLSKTWWRAKHFSGQIHTQISFFLPSQMVDDRCKAKHGAVAGLGSGPVLSSETTIRMVLVAILQPTAACDKIVKVSINR